MIDSQRGAKRVENVPISHISESFLLMFQCKHIQQFHVILIVTCSMSVLQIFSNHLQEEIVFQVTCICRMFKKLLLLFNYYVNFAKSKMIVKIIA